MLIFFEGRVEGEHDVQGLDDGVVDSGVNRDVQDVAGYSAVIG